MARSRRKKAQGGGPDPIDWMADYLRKNGDAPWEEVKAAAEKAGVEASHPDFTGTVTNVNSGGAASSHGHATAGIVFGNGTSNPAVRGMAPDCGSSPTTK